MSNYSTALYLLMLSFLIAILFSSKGTKVSFSFSILGIIVLSIFIQLFLVSFLDLLINFSLGSLNTSRFIEIKHYVITNHMGDNMWARVDRWLESLLALKNYPIFGIIQTKLNYSGGYLVGFGQHSQFLDVFALFGFGIGSLQVYIFLQPIFKRFKNIDNTYSGMSILLLFLIVILFTVNNVTPSIGFAFFFIFPTVYDWKQKAFVKKSNLTKTK